MIRGFFLSVLVIAAAKSATPNGSDATLVYKQVGQRALHLYEYRPVTGPALSPSPCLVYLHGGGWIMGNPGMAKPTTAVLCRHGFVVISVEYRLISRDPKADPAPCIEDAKSAMRYVRGHARELGIDPHRIAAGGASAGGHLAAACALLTSFDAPTDDRGISCIPDALVLAVPVLDNGPTGYKGTVPAIAANVQAYSPAYNARAGAPPTIIFSGRDDNVERTPLVEKFAERLRALGNDCELHLYPGAHDFYLKPPASDDLQAKTVAFFARLGWIASDR